ncbi:MAG: SurA N-terminal domain-containing protein [Candidatus Polarisedimenticolaceae bacterium]|nr:SurA N-terminal domain-containing protein [Candidatus Polarisedimenticolaceae bacterium]
MLQAIRDKAQGWIAWLIVGLISVPFALWGIQEYIGVGVEPALATVGDVKITERQVDNRFQDFRQNLQERLGAAYQPGLFDDEKMKREVLEEMINENVILQASLGMGLRVGDIMVRDMILAQETFQIDGRFDQETYERNLRMQGQSSASFEERVRQYLLGNQLAIAVTNSELVTDHEINEAVRLALQKRDVAYYTIPAAKYISEDEISDSDLRAHYEASQEQFRVPEQVQLEYLRLDAAVISPLLEAPTEEQLLAYYETNKEGQRQNEQRRASHILIAVDDNDDVARQQIIEIQNKLNSGSSFAELAKSESQDPGSSEEGGDLGFFERGIMDKAFEDAAFSLQQGEVSGPVRSEFGYHLIKLTEIKGADIKPFSEVRDEIEVSYRSSEVERLFFDYVERLGDHAFESPDSLEPAAEALGITIQKTGWLNRESRTGLFSSTKVSGAAFSEDVLEQGNNSELLELSADDVVVLRVLEHKTASILPFDDVKLRIEDSLRIQRAEEQAESVAKEALARLRAGELIDQVAVGAEIARPGAVDRNTLAMPRPLLAQLFKQPKDESGSSFGSAKLDNGDQVVFELIAVTDGLATDIEQDQLSREKSNLQQMRGRDYYDRLVQDLRSRADVTLN